MSDEGCKHNAAPDECSDAWYFAMEHPHPDWSQHRFDGANEGDKSGWHQTRAG
jgi:hypothetical protein